MNKLQKVGGVWLPAHEVHMVEWMKNTGLIVDGVLTYQYGKLAEAMKWVKQWRTAIDIGAHCGTWSMHLAKRFAHLIAFEPVPLHREALALNFAGVADCPAAIEVHHCALGDVEGSVAMQTVPGSSGDSSVDGAGAVLMHRLDRYGFRDIDFVKVDCNGYELLVLRGGEATLLANRPCISVEQKQRCTDARGLPDRGAIIYLESLGAKVRHAHGGVYVMSWD